MSDSYSTRKGKKCVLYLRVSLERQVEGYSLEGQKRYLKDWAEFEGMAVVDTYVDAGKSGKSISGRDEFQRMLDDISTRRIDIDYVIVFKLSRFGRNAKDVLNSLSQLQRYGVNLICKEDGLDSSTSMGRMMITILGAVAEMERENILAQSMLGREEKAKQGGWNGGIAPYGYDLQNGKLEIKEDEARIVALIFDKFVNEAMGYSTIAKYLNEQGIPKPATKTSNGRPFTDWTVQHIKKMLSNPVYTGRVTYGRTRQKRVEGTDNEFRRVRSTNYITSSKISHEPIIDDKLFEKAQLKYQETAVNSPKIGRAPKHLLSGILRCPQCGSAMIADHSGWQNRGGSKKEVLNYQCGHHSGARGGQCKKNAIRAEWVETEVIEYTKRLIQNPKFAEDIQAQIGQQSDGVELSAEIEGYRKRLKKLETSKANLEQDIDNIADGDRNAERKRKDMNTRLNKLYDDIYDLENQISSCEQKRLAIAQNMLTLETIYNMLGVFDKMFDVMDAADKRKVMETLVAEVQLYPKATWKEDRSPIKAIIYTFPIHPEVLKTFGCNCNNVVTVYSPGYSFFPFSWSLIWPLVSVTKIPKSM